MPPRSAPNDFVADLTSDAAIDEPISDVIASEPLTAFERCQERIGYRFKNMQLLESALTHASGAQHRLSSNERLEFLGDSVLGLVICETVFSRLPDQLEGDLTRIKSVVVSRSVCAQVSTEMGIAEFLIVGKGMAGEPQVPTSLLADVFEALIAAIYLDGGMEAAKRFILDNISAIIDAAIAGGSIENYKSQLQQEVQRVEGLTPNYMLLDEKGPDHSKCFKIAARVGDALYGAAWGRSKKEAEQKAACNALLERAGQPAMFPCE